MRASTRPVGGASSDNDSAPSRPLSPALGSEDGSASEGEWQQPRSRSRRGGYQSGKVSASFNAAEPDPTDAPMGHVFPGTVPEFPTLDASPKTQKSDGVEGAAPAADIKIVPCYFGSYNHRARFRIAARWNCYPKAPPGKARDSEAKEVCRFGRSCRLTLFEDQVLQQPADPEAEFKPVDSSTRVAIEGTQRPASGDIPISEAVALKKAMWLSHDLGTLGRWQTPDEKPLWPIVWSKGFALLFIPDEEEDLEECICRKGGSSATVQYMIQDAKTRFLRDWDNFTHMGTHIPNWCSKGRHVKHNKAAPGRASRDTVTKLWLVDSGCGHDIVCRREVKV